MPRPYPTGDLIRNYNPQIHHRRSRSLPNYDYGQPGAYFVTICVQGRDCLFGEIVDGKMQLNEVGRTVVKSWDEIPQHFTNVKLDEFVVMPNHVHGILFITNVGATHASPNQKQAIDVSRARHASPLRHNLTQRSKGPKRHSLGTIVGAFKSAVTKRINERRGMPGVRLWQRNYYEHVIGDDADLQHLREYVVNNPLKWELDQLHPNNPSKW